MRGTRRTRGATKMGRSFLSCVTVCAALMGSSPAYCATSEDQRTAPLTCETGSSNNAADALARFRCLSATGQAAVIRDRIDDGTLSAMTDAELVALIDAMKPDAFVAYARIVIGGEHSYEYWMRRRERVNGKWPTQADHMDVRCQDTPRRLYVRWLPDGAHAGQEIIYDETRDPQRFMGHFGGPWRFVSGTFPIDGALAQIQSRHSVRDLGLQFIVSTLEHDARSFEAEGLSAKPGHINVLNVDGERVLALTWDAPDGPPAHFAPRVMLTFDLHRAWLRGVTAWSLDGTLLEKIDFDEVVPRAWTDSTFDPRNPSYAFR